MKKRNCYVNLVNISMSMILIMVMWSAAAGNCVPCGIGTIRINAACDFFNNFVKNIKQQKMAKMMQVRAGMVINDPKNMELANSGSDFYCGFGEGISQEEYLEKGCRQIQTGIYKAEKKEDLLEAFKTNCRL